jgi:capsular polysaccharide biosynthesis protein
MRSILPAKPNRIAARQRVEPAVDWIDTEESVWRGASIEVSRMARRAKSRWLVVLLVAIVMTAGITAFIAKKPAKYEASVTLTLFEGTMSRRQTFLPITDLRNYVVSVLMNGPALLEIIEQKNWYPLRKKLGYQYAMTELMEQTDVQVQRNYFLYAEDNTTPRSARIEIEVVDADPDKAYEVADAVATVISETVMSQGKASAGAVSAEVKSIQQQLSKRLKALEQREFSVTSELEKAKIRRDQAAVGALNVEQAGLMKTITNLQRELSATSQTAAIEALSQEISAAGQDVTIRRVTASRPTVPGSQKIRLVAVAAVVFVFMLVATVLALGAFDSRIHDTEDIRRLGLPVAGHLPGFPGDHVGAFKTRGNAGGEVPGRVPLLKLWR